jgi:hypothetical protein
MAGLILSVLLPGSLAPALLLLYCPGWGLVRLVSVIDRAFFILGASLCCSVLVLGGMTLLAGQLDWAPQRLALACHSTSVLLCAIGRLRMARYDRWQAQQPVHPSPMPLWPDRLGLCLAITAVTVLLAAWAADPVQPSARGQQLELAVAAQTWLAGPEHPAHAGAWFGSGGLHSAAAAALAAGSGLHTVVASGLLCLSALVACLILAAESICRLWGNRGGPGAMAALLLGLNPLAGLFLVFSDTGGSLAGRLSAPLDPNLVTALRPFVEASPLALTLAFAALLLSATLSVLRRASYHVPRLMALATLGLVASDVTCAWLLLPGWFVGLACSRVACARHPDARLRSGSAGRRAGEPACIRAPFWRPGLHIVVGAALGLTVTHWPEVRWQPSGLAAWGLVAAVLPSGLAFIPGVRHLNASPGREAYFFLGLLGVSIATALCFSIDGPRDVSVAALLALILAVPASNGAMKLLDSYGLGARMGLGALVIALSVGPLLWLIDAAGQYRPVAVLSDRRVAARDLSPALREALQVMAQQAPMNAVLTLALPLDDDELLACRLMLGRALLQDLDDAHALQLAEQLPTRAERALLRLRNRPGLAGRELWAIHSGPSWPGFQPVASAHELSVSRARPPDVVLLTISSLRSDRLNPVSMPNLSARAERGLRFDSVITPMPARLPGLSTLLTGLSPVDHDVRSAQGRLPHQPPRLARTFAEWGYRTAAVVSLPGDQGLLDDFEDVTARPRATHDSLVTAARERLSSGDRRPLFLWVHLSDLELPYDVPADARTEATGAFPFPPSPNLALTHYGVAAFPPSPLPGGDAGLVDVATGVAQYDALVSLLDQALARLFDSIPEDDLLIVTAPHGTSLSEHEAWFVAGPDLFEPSIRVPLVLVGAGMPSGRHTRLTGLQDVAGLILTGELAERERVLLMSDWRPGLGLGRAYDPILDPTCRGASLRIWGERTQTGKTLLTRAPDDALPAAGVSFDLSRDPSETAALPADDFVLRRIDAWRRRGRPARLDR